jgi:hypothetical protein
MIKGKSDQRYTTILKTPPAVEMKFRLLLNRIHSNSNIFITVENYIQLYYTRHDTEVERTVITELSD